MRTLQVTAGDLVISNGDFAMISDNEELAQSVRMNIEAAKGEWFLDEEYGMDREPFEEKPFNEEAARLALVEAATADERIEAVAEIEMTPDFKTRRLKVRMELTKLNTDETIVLEGVEI